MKLTSGISTHLFFITNKSVTPNNYLKKIVSLKFILYEHNVNEIGEEVTNMWVTFCGCHHRNQVIMHGGGWKNLLKVNKPNIKVHLTVTKYLKLTTISLLSVSR